MIGSAISIRIKNLKIILIAVHWYLTPFISVYQNTQKGPFSHYFPVPLVLYCPCLSVLSAPPRSFPETAFT